jgi:SAM-dependent methyltransferase
MPSRLTLGADQASVIHRPRGVGSPSHDRIGGNASSYEWMRVRRNFEQIYSQEKDPWGIGDADSDRYNLYVERILAGSRHRGSVLELGCGYGALIARLRDEFERLVGVDVSAGAVHRGRERFPFIEWSQGSLADPGAALPDAGRFDTIIVSDVLYYLGERDRRNALGWIADHLAPGGLAFLAGWSPGGRYLTRQEFRNLVERELRIESEEMLETGHVLFQARRRRTLAALTVDYETWQPQLPGVPLDWETDALGPTARLLDVFDEGGATLTIFAELGEYLWLSENRPEVAERMAHQWRDAVTRGHDVQLHLHPNWLPEMAPQVEGGRWTWNMERSRAADYPGDLTEAIARCKQALQDAIRPVKPDYEVVAFRAGTYEAQPFSRLYDALVANDIWCDSSVLPGDSRPDRHYDYRHAYADHQPWFASRFDPQLKAPPSERAIVEVPVFAYAPGQRWTFDAEEGLRFAGRLRDRLRRERRRPSSERLRLRSRLSVVLNDAYWRLRGVRRQLNRVMPRTLAWRLVDYPRERLVGTDYFTLVAHTKLELNFDAIARGLRELRSDGVEVVSLAELAREARDELVRSVSASPGEEAVRQVQREYSTVMADDAHVSQSRVLQRLVPVDRVRIFDAGCGGGNWSAALARLHPRAVVVGADVGADFVARATERYAGPRVSFRVEDFAALSFADCEFDCVYADNSLEHAFDVQRTLRELHRVLAPGGCLVAAIPPDGTRTSHTCDNHTWKTTAEDVRARMDDAGFRGVEVRQRDVFRELGESPFPPSGDQMLYVRAWKRDHPVDQRSRVRELTTWAYQALEPTQAQASNDPVEILAGGHAWCWGYVVVLGDALLREGFRPRWVTMVAEGHPLGLGPEQRDSHEVLEVSLDDGSHIVCDPMVGIVFDASLQQLLADPSLADTERPEDERYRERNYALYSTSEWYRRVRRVAVRSRPGQRLRLRAV